MTIDCTVVGYASVDFKWLTAPFEGAGRTTLITEPANGSGSGEAGAAYYFARALARHGVDTSVVSWVGADANGNCFINALSAEVIGTDGVRQEGPRSPSCHMYYGSRDEDLVNFFDPGAVEQSLTEAQRAVIAKAQSVLIGVGPPEATADALDAVNDEATLMWVVKADPASVPPQLARNLASRANLICHSESEMGFLTDTCGLDLAAISRSGTVVVQTHGVAGARCWVGGESMEVSGPDPVAATDTTGAGDTFAGSLLGRLLTGEADPRNPPPAAIDAAVRGAGLDARQMLHDRQNGTTNG